MSEDHMIQKTLSPESHFSASGSMLHLRSSDTFYEFEIAYWQAQVCVNYTKGLYLR